MIEPCLAGALVALKVCRQLLITCRVESITAKARLADSHADRAAELIAEISDALLICERLTMCVEADLRYEEITNG